MMEGQVAVRDMIASFRVKVLLVRADCVIFLLLLFTRNLKDLER